MFKTRPRTVRAVFVAILTVLALSAGCASAPPAPPRLDIRGEAYDGGQVRFDGAYYDFRAANGIQMIKMWVPPNADPIRGILFHGNPGGYGDTRNMPRDERLQEFAARHGFAVLGVTSFPGRQVYPDLAEVVVRALDDWAKLGRHPEIANLPIIARGSSNAGVTAYSLACYVPERMICFTPNVGPRYNPPSPPDAALKVPALLHVGPTDPFFRTGVEDTRALFEDVRPRGARWAWTAEQGKGHEIRHVDDVDMKFYETCIALRLPADADPRTGPVVLRDLPEEEGWLVDADSWESGITRIAPYAEYEGDKSRAGWVPTADIACLYRSIATYDNPISIALADLGPVDNPNESGVMLRSVGGRLIDPGSRIAVECDVSGVPGWQSLTFHDGADEIAAIQPGAEPKAEFVVEPGKTVYALSALVENAVGEAKTSYPLHFLVRDPALEPALTAQRAAAAFVRPPRPRPAYGSSAMQDGPGTVATAADPSDQVLLAYGLTPEQEKGFAVDGRRSDFWQEFGAAQDFAMLTVEENLADRGEGGNPGAAQPAGDARMAVCAARSRAGLYLLFEVEDDDFVPPRGLEDSVDFHLSRLSSEQIWAAAPEDVFVKRESWALVLPGDQFQINIGDDWNPPTQVFRNFPDPWDVNRWEDDLAAAKAKCGVMVDCEPLGPGRRAVEWFIPWDYVGTGDPMEEPATGTRLGFNAGYNDRDAGQHSEGEFDRLRWCNRLDPWWQAGDKGPDPSPWGDLEMGPMVSP